jgi:hypothetical protein
MTMWEEFFEFIGGLQSPVSLVEGIVAVGFSLLASKIC